MDKNKARVIVNDILVAMKEIEAKYDVKITSKGGVIHSTSLLAKLQVSEIGAGGEVETPELSTLKRFFPKLATGKVFILNGKRVRFTGYNLSAKKYNFIYTDLATGKSYKTFRAVAESAVPA